MEERSLYRNFALAAFFFILCGFCAVFYGVTIDLAGLVCGVAYSLLSLIFYAHTWKVVGGTGSKKKFLLTLGVFKLALLVAVFLFFSWLGMRWLLSALLGYMVIVPSAILTALQKARSENGQGG